jgi:anaerobic magnesium-protoporphyrin IX monomethyl ester cyclase
MRIIVCNRLTEYLGIEIISALLKRAGHEVQLIFEPDVLTAGFVRGLPQGLAKHVDSAQRTARRVVAAAPDLVLFPSEINSFDWCARVGKAIKEQLPDVWLLHGGFHATSTPEDCISRDGVDMLCQGEGDHAVPELIEALAAGRDHRKIPNIWVKDPDGTIHRNSPRPLIQDLDSLPYPDKDLYYDVLPGLQKEYMCVASRGCHWACSFCFYTTLYDLYGQEGFLRARSPGHVIGELKVAKEKYDIEYVVFHDDIFPTSLKWLKEFAPLYKEEIGLPFSCITHPQLIREETADLLGEMGCKYVIMGSQTVNEGSRAPEVINRTESSEEIAAAVRRLKKWGVFVLLDHIFGIPGETQKDQEDALRFYVDTGADVIKPFFLSYFPGTDLSRRANEAKTAVDEEESKGQWDHFMFEGELSGPDYRAYNLAYALFPVLGDRGRRLMVRAGLHRKLAPIGGLPGLGNIILFPRLLTGLLTDRDIRPKLYLNYLRTILKYQLRPGTEARNELD